MPSEEAISKIQPIQVLEDNIIWVWYRGKEAVVVDPAVTAPVKKWLENNGLKLIAVLQTHHHSDHIGGTKGLLKSWPNASVIAAEADIERIPFQTFSVKGGDNISLLGTSIEVLNVSAHTKNHIAYFLPKVNKNSSIPALFCGDTLFSGGCGRLFEGSPHDMYKAIQKLCSLPAETEVFCAHEYTESNLKWANNLLPNDAAIKNKLNEVIKLRRKGATTLPSTIREEKLINLFVRSSSPEELGKLRLHKDSWQN